MKGRAIIIRESTKEDMVTVGNIHESAFDQNDEARLVANLLNDPSAKPCLSLVAVLDGSAVVHILFSKVTIDDADQPTSAAILAPLAILPEFQRQSIGEKLIRGALVKLADDGTKLVFVLGHPDYYSRFGFHPAGKQGFAAPYPISPEHADAWMVQELVAGAIDSVSGKVICADALDKPEYWIE
ncbi:MAG: GNAT family N-acetyltransferase [Alphaproteobacteria bacterium]